MHRGGDAALESSKSLQTVPTAEEGDALPLLTGKVGDMSANSGNAFAVLRQAKQRALRVTVAGGILLCIGIALHFALPAIVDVVVWKETSITSTESMLYEAWIDPSTAGVNIYRSYTFYNLTNPDDVVAGLPPNFIERGPYVYYEYRRKNPVSVQWFDNGTVGYTYSSSFVFAPELSVDAVTGESLLDSDVVVAINAPLVGLTHRLSRLPDDLGHIGPVPITKQECCVLLDLMVNATVGPQGIFVQRRIHEFLWGYDDPIWIAVHTALNDINYTASKKFRSEWNGSYVVPSPYSFRSGQMCPLWEHNGECNNTANLATLEGSGSLRNGPVPQGHLSQWAGQRRLWWWGDEIDGYTGGMDIQSRPHHAAPDYSIVDSDPCHTVSGSDGLRFGPHVTPSSQLTLFLDMLWRAVPLTFWKSTEVQGIPAHSFSLGKSAMDNTSDVNRHCFQMDLDGIFNFSRPLYGPAFATKARFLDAPLTSAQVNYTVQRYECGGASGPCDNWNLTQPLPVLEYLEKYFQRDSNPEAFRDTFESHLDVHGLTGITLTGTAQGEAMTFLKPVAVDGCPGLFQRAASITPTLYPLVNVARSTEVSAAYASKLRTAMTLLVSAQIGLYVLIGVGVLLLVGGWLRHNAVAYKLLSVGA